MVTYNSKKKTKQCETRYYIGSTYIREIDIDLNRDNYYHSMEEIKQKVSKNTLDNQDAYPIVEVKICGKIIKVVNYG